MRAVLYACFFLSGAAALVYEIVWHRMLTVVFGLSTMSVAAVLSAFLGGLALGARLFGGAADRVDRPMRLYASLQLGVVASVAISLQLIPRILGMYERLFAGTVPGPVTSNLARFGLAFAAIGLPCVFIGGTVPVMARLVSAWARSVGVAFGRFNAVNTLGAVTGAGLAGFVLLPLVGVQRAMQLTISVNGLLGLSALAFSVWSDRASAGPRAAPSRMQSPVLSGAWQPHTPPSWFAGVAAGLSGVVALGLETVWIRLLAVYTHNSVYVFTMVVTVFLAALAVGSGLAARLLRRPDRSPLRVIVAVQGLLAISGPLLLAFAPSAAGLRLAEDERPDGQVLLAEYLLTTAMVFAPTLLIGMTVPMLIAALAPADEFAGRGVARVYAWNAVGNIAGAALTGTVLAPLVGLRGAVLALSVLSFALASAAWMLEDAREQSARWRAVFAAGALAFVGVTAALPSAVRFHRSAGPDERVLYYAEGPSATVHVSELETEGKRHRTLFVDSQSVAGTYDEIVTDQKMLAHVPLLLHPTPARALTVGFGTGGTSYSMLQHRVAVDCAEIEPRVADAYRFFESENFGLVGPNHERHDFHLVLDDARAWLHVAPKPYDVIVTDVTSIQYRGNGNLYTTDYFALMRRNLTANGLGCAWVPITGVTAEQLKVLIRSFRSVYPHTSVWYMVNLPTDFVILVGTPKRLAVDLTDWTQRAGRAGIQKDLARVGLDDPYKLLSCLLMAEEDAAAYAGVGPLHTDDHPILDYLTHSTRNRNSLSVNLGEMMQHRSEIVPYVAAWPETPAGQKAPRDRLARWRGASEHLIHGHILMRGSDPERFAAAQSAYREAAALVPEDARTKALVVELDP